MSETSTLSKRSFKKTILYTLLMAVLIILDQLTKSIVLKYLAVGKVVTPIPHVVQFRYVENTGAAFSILSGKTVLLVIITILILLFAFGLLFFERIPNSYNQVAVVLMAAGGIGNLIDRIHRHYVVDFIEFIFTNFAVFNFADCCVTIGAAILVVSTLLSVWKDDRKKKSDAKKRKSGTD